MSKQVQKVCNAISTAAVVLVVILALLLVGVRLVGLRPMCVLSGSMEPTYHTGSLIYVKPCAPEDVQVGDAITFVLNEDLDVVTHRVISIDAENEHFYTQGDANDAPDGAPVYFKNLIGRPVFTIPYLGFVSHWVSNPPGMYLAIAIAIVLIVLAFLPDMLRKAAEADVLVVALAVGATWAYLTAQTGPVVNTFTVGKLFDQGGALTLKEHKAVAQTSGEYSYKVNAEEVTGNEYNLLPGTKIEKDPFVKVTGLKAGASCYLYVEVVASDASSVLNYSVADTWELLAGVTGKNGGAVYVYKTNDGNRVTADVTATSILASNLVNVNDFDVNSDATASLTFYGYLCQSAGFADAAAAFNECF